VHREDPWLEILERVADAIDRLLEPFRGVLALNMWSKNTPL
jgi:hypothetical protein